MAGDRKGKITRRRFLGYSAAAAGTFTIVPRHVLGGNRHTAASEKLNIAGIGVGGMGTGNVNSLAGTENIVALCDVDDNYAAKMYKKYPDATKYRDFRKMFEKEKNIDAVVVSTPDHSHFVISMTAIQHRKHVYCEKPLTQTIEQAQRVADAAAKAGVATQMGIRGQASEGMKRTQEMIADGAIGEVREVHLWTNRPTGRHGWVQGADRPKESPAVPDYLDWDLWLGPTPVRPYHPIYHPFKWRGWWDFGTGALGDMGCHILDVPFRALNLGYPETVQAVCTPVNKETFPLGSIVTYEFPKRGSMPPVTMTWYDGGLKPPRPKELEDGRKMPDDGGVLFIGDKGKMLEGRIIPETRMSEYSAPAKTLPRSPGHYVEWIQACKGGQPAGANFEYSSLLTQVVLMGNVAIRPELRKILSQQELKWDANKKQFSNVAEANEFLSFAVRQGWEI